MMSDNLTKGPIRALLVAPTPDATWLREIRLPFPPFPGLGIRLDVYDMVNVDSVEVGDDTRGDVNVTCFVSWEGGGATDERWTRVWFEQGVYV